jgi:hypothetical protein
MGQISCSPKYAGGGKGGKNIPVRLEVDKRNV